MSREGSYAAQLREAVANLIADENVENAERVDVLIAIISLIEQDWQKRLVLEILHEVHPQGLSTEEIAVRLNDRIKNFLVETVDDHKPLP
jgi:phosphoribulokinase